MELTTRIEMLGVCQWDMILLFRSSYRSNDELIMYLHYKFENVIIHIFKINYSRWSKTQSKSQIIFCAYDYLCDAVDVFHKKQSTLKTLWRHQFQRILIKSIINFREYNDDAMTPNIIWNSEIYSIKTQNIDGYMINVYYIQNVWICSWFMGALSRKESERLLLSPGNEMGCFLIRESETSPGTCSYWHDQHM
jgi:hypothetical protein